jgi:hypothetical protein
MAATLTRDGELTFVSFPIAKAETDEDGNVIVYGKASDGSVDSDEQIIEPEFAAHAIKTWLGDGANVRVQHNPQRDPAGVGVAMDVDSDGGTWVKSKIIEPIAQKLVLGGALRAYSVGIARPQIVRDARARGGLIKGGQVVEISLVDRPANKNCSIQLVKAAKNGLPEFTGKIFGDDAFIQRAVGSAYLLKVGPKGYVHGWLKIGGDAIANDHPTADKMGVNALRAHLDSYHSGLPQIGRKTGKKFGKAELLAMHEEMHRAQEEAVENRRLRPVTRDGMLVDWGLAHTHGIGNVPKPDYTKKGAGVTAAVAEKTVTLELPDDVSVAFTPADLAKVLARKSTDIVKAREPNVGEDKTPGGVDRADMPASDFAGRDRSFPIHSPGDVADAAQSIGRAGDDNYSGEQLEANIKRVAHEKGPEYVAELPESWKSADLQKKKKSKKSKQPTQITVEGDGDQDHDGDGLFDADGDGDGAVARRAEKGAGDCPTCHGGGKIRDGSVKCPDCDGSGNAAAEKGKKPFPGAAPPFVKGGGRGKWDDDADDVEKGKKGKKKGKPFPGAAEPFGAKEPVEKKKKQKVLCPSCGANVHDEHAFCPECGKKVPGSATQIEKNHDFTCLGCGKQLDKGEQYCPGCGKENPGYLPEADQKIDKGRSEAGEPMGEVPEKTGELKKAKKMRKAAQARSRKAARIRKAARARLQKADQRMRAAKKLEKNVTKRSPDAGVKGFDGKTDRIPAHREPDGGAVEAFERDAHMTDGDDVTKSVNACAMMRIVKAGVPADMGILHDMTCPAFSPATIAKAYPDRTLSATVDETAWQVKSLDLAANSPYHEAARAAALGQHATTLKSALAAEIWDAHEELHKAFSDANPGPGAAITPADCQPGMFQRPYLSAGHAAPSPAQGMPNQTPITSGEIEAAQFKRPYLSAGHSAESPGTGTPNSVPAPSAATKAATALVTAGNALEMVKAGRTFYSNSGKETTRTAMRAIHDHIQHTFPDICPMKGEGAAAAPDATPVGKGVAEPIVRQLTKSAKPAVKKARSKKRAQVKKPALTPEMKLAQDALPEVTKSAEAPVIAPFVDEHTANELAALRSTVQRQGKLLKKQAKALDTQTKTLDQLSALPDPNVMAYRGAALAPLATKMQQKTSALVEPTMADVAERTKAMMMKELETEFRTSPYPAQREAAWRSILQLRGVG